ncbi:unnamed protein product [Chondrus crispus]|uniref:Glycosyltransferase 2-like domain-containing protein n=1 Tax=Chondrus crispus TaxID=2769 RepID=R7QME7_CHOCR|nr:unnamed protein product [Chondrus crispus]CDF38651.1 unnamed protein product [Chondrus crispus]|eukprot:XP_005718556.1 unnamed protein product [Chondrus crispus]
MNFRAVDDHVSVEFRFAFVNRSDQFSSQRQHRPRQTPSCSGRAMSTPQANAPERRTMNLSKHPQTTARILLIFFVAFLVLNGQLYIGSTIAGTRPRRHDSTANLRSVRSYADLIWEECAQIINLGLPDIGDAGRIWLKHAFVGTNVDPSDKFIKPEKPDVTARDKYKCRCQIPEVHAGRQPRLTAIVQSFNHHANIANISTALKRSSVIEEIVISEDGSTDGSLHDWQSSLPDPSHFIIRSNNLHELRSYNRAMRMASGDFVVLLQDDDLLPMSDEWVQNALRLFEALPELGVLGGYIGQLWDHATGVGYEYGEQTSTHGGLRKGNTQPLPFIEPTTGLPFMYAECVWIAPVFVRRSLLRRAGGLELTIAKRGEPGVWQDCVLSYEAWVNGFSVGAYSAKFERGVGGHGSATSSLKVKQRERVYERAMAYTNRKFPRRRIHDSIVAMNNQTLEPRRFPA